MKKVAVSIHATDDFNPNIIKGLNGLDYIHVDVMDGKFVDNVNVNLNIFKILKENSGLPIIAHMMVINPLDYIDKIINYIDIFTFHFEIDGNKKDIIDIVKGMNKKVGIAINPNTEISEIIPYLDDIDIILIMSVYPGWSGQEFIPETIKKVDHLAEYKKVYDFEIEVDGGVTLENSKRLINTDIISSASTILKAKDPNVIIKTLKFEEKHG